MTQTPEPHQEPGEGTHLGLVLAPLVIWGLHFLFCYVWTAIACEKQGRASPLHDTQTAILSATGVALILILLAVSGVIRRYRRSLSDNDFEFEVNSPEERHRFLGHMTLMLGALSAIGMIYAAIPVFYLDSCR